MDTDGDIIVDSVETELGLFPEAGFNFFTDLDSGTLIDLYEALLGTHPMVKDSDADMFHDGYEHAVGSHPMDPDCTPFEGCSYSSTSSIGLIFFDGFESGGTSNWSQVVD